MPVAETLGLLGAAGGGILSGIGSFLGPDTPQPGEAFIVNPNLQNDPLNVALSFDALMQLGNLEGAEALLQRNNPLNQVISRINEAPLPIDTKNTAIGVARHVYENGQLPSPTDLGDLGTWQTAIQRYQLALGAAGVPQELLNNLNPQGRDAFNASISERVKQASESGVGAARASALKQLSDRILGMEEGTGTFENLTDVASRTISEQRDEEARLLRQNALAAANAGGYNPAGILGEIEKERLRQATATPLQAAELAGTLASQEDRDLQNLLTFLGFGSTTAQQSAAVTNQAALGSAGIAANQLAAANASRQATPSSTGAGLDSLGGTLTTLGLLGGSGFFSKPGVSDKQIPAFTSSGTSSDPYYSSVANFLGG